MDTTNTPDVQQTEAKEPELTVEAPQVTPEPVMNTVGAEPAVVTATEPVSKTPAVIYDGEVTMGKLKQLAQDYLADTLHDPRLNPNAISLVKQADGNWKGYGTMYGNLIEVREQMPEHALMRILTHG